MLEGPVAAVPADDRGLHYGDGVFETMAVLDGRIRLFEWHCERLAHGCARLDIALEIAPVVERLGADARCLGDGVIKLLVTRGSGPRGYRPPIAPPSAQPAGALPAARVRVFQHALSPGFGEDSALRVRICETRLGMNPALAGIKHLNRLEQVMAQNEWHSLEDDQKGCDEGLMLDTQGHVVCATAANVIAVQGEVLQTPSVRNAGVAGVMRRAVMACAAQIGLRVSPAVTLTPDDLVRCDEVMLSNAVHGLRSVTRLGSHTYTRRDVARRLRQQLREFCAL